MAKSTEINKKYAQKINQMNNLMASIKSHIESGKSDKINWSDIGTMEHVVSVLNDLDNSLYGRADEKNIIEKVWSKSLNRYVTIPE